MMNEQEETEFYNRIHSRDHFLNPPKDIVFLQIRLEEKSRDEDWRAFLDFASRETMVVYTLRGYGSSPGEAATDAWNTFIDPEERFWEISGYRPWQ
jgi:hypothetical protein